MPVREKVNSIYVSKQENVAINALEKFKADRIKLSLTHSDIYKAGLALYAVNPTLILTCKMLMMNNKLTAKDLADYFSTELEVDLNSSSTHKTQDGNEINELSLLLNKQSTQINQLSTLITEQKQLIHKLNLGQIPPGNQKLESIETPDKLDISETLDAYDNNGKTILSGVVRDTAHIGSSKAREKIRAAKSNNIL